MLKTFTVEFTTVDCVTCSVYFAIPEQLEKSLRKSGDKFYCPHGHGMSFIVGKTKEQKLQEQLDKVKLNREHLRDQLGASERSNTALRGVVTRKGNQLDKVKQGVCPCCNRYFNNVHRHMKTKHPSYDPKESDDKLKGEE